MIIKTALTALALFTLLIVIITAHQAAKNNNTW